MNRLSIRFRAARRALAGAAYALLPMLAAAAEPVPIAAFFGQPEIGAVALSPSGKTLALTVPGKDKRMELVVADLDQQPLKFRTIAWLRDYEIRNVYWLNDRRLVFQAFDSQASDWAGTTGLWAADIDGEDMRMLIDPQFAGFRAVTTGNRNILSNEWTLHSIPRDLGDDVFIEKKFEVYNGRVLHRMTTGQLARLNTRVPTPKLMSTGAPEGAQNWLIDQDGKLRFVETFLDDKRQIFWRGEESWKELASFPFPSTEGWAPRFVLDGALLVATEPKGAVGSQLVVFDPATGQPSAQAVLAGKGFDVGSNAEPIVDRQEHKLIGWRYQLDTVYTRWLDEGMAKAQVAIDRALTGRANEIRCQTCLQAKRWLVVSWSDREPPQYFVFERASGKLTRIGSAQPEVPAGAGGSRSFHRIKARDGRELPVYVTRPPASAVSAQGPLPAVLYIHGGPWVRGASLEWSYDSTPQFLASRGYLVIEPEFRGSAGYGTELLRAGDRQWGLRSQDDMQDALQWTIDQGWVDKNRVCIMGASYGGYAALMGPVRYPDAYRCAISWVGPTDLPALVKQRRQGANKSQIRFDEVAIGVEDQLRATSPVNKAAEIKVPVLAAWGKDDRRVPLDDQARAFRSAAQAAKVDLEYVEYAEEGHVWLKPETRIDFFTRAEKLLSRTIGAK